MPNGKRRRPALLAGVALVPRAAAFDWPSNCTDKPNPRRNPVTLLEECDCNIVGKFDVPDGETAIPLRAFQGCLSLTNVTGMANVTSVGNHAFSQTGLTSFAWPSSAAAVPAHCFSGAASLASITNLENVDTVGDSAFSGTGLTSFAWPSRATTVPIQCFSGAASLASITNLEKVNTVGDLSLIHISEPTRPY